MIVVSDTSPLTSLLQIRKEGLLFELYGTVIIPGAVERELRRAHAELPMFLKVVSPQSLSSRCRASQGKSTLAKPKPLRWRRSCKQMYC